MKNEQKLVVWAWVAFFLYWAVLLLLWSELRGFALNLLSRLLEAVL
ncbi:hypothetical protein HY992_01330 [Candidatus Micrarchaeota archaeon]|nr:hypothetical protein [Candidatus Micrarchaeota archaeon]